VTIYAKIQQQFHRNGALLMLGRHADLAKSYQFPLTVQLEGNAVTLQTSGQLIQLLRALHRALLRRGVMQVQSDILAIELPRQGRLRVWTNWEEIGRSSRDHRTSSAIYSGQITSNGFMINSVNYTRLSMPELRNLYPPTALSA
jgi:hypothetical protein